MPNFCVNENAQPSGEHEVHNIDAGYSYLPLPENRYHLGWFEHCSGAVCEAGKYFSNIDGCTYCASACHHR